VTRPMGYDVLGMYIIIILVLAVVTFSTKNVIWFKVSLTVLSASVSIFIYRLSENYSAKNIPPELLANEGSYWYIIFFWPVVTFFVCWGTGWLARPKVDTPKR